MKSYRIGTILWSVGLIVIGALLLLFNLGFLTAYRSFAEYLLAAGFVVAGIVAFGTSARNPQNWWHLILAWTFLALAVTIGLSTYAELDRPILAATLLTGITLAFIHVYWIDRRSNWWSLIPSGFLFVVGVVSALNVWISNTSILGSILIAGLGLVFIVLYLLEDKSRFWWALIPGGALLTVALVTLTSDLEPTNLLLRSWPLLLILAGIYVGWKTSQPQSDERLEVSHAPKMRKKAGVGAKPESPYGSLGDYSQAAPGTTIDILAERD